MRFTALCVGILRSIVHLLVILNTLLITYGTFVVGNKCIHRVENGLMYLY